VHVANVQQQNWFTAVATQVVLPHFAEAHRPFVLVFWSRDPDGTQHFNGDSLNALTPGINGPTSLAGVRNADDDLKALRAALRALHLEDDTDIVVTADHGFSTAAKASATSAAAARAYRDVPTGLLPRGFLAADLAAALKLPLFEGNRLPIDPAAGEHPRSDGQLIGSDPGHPEIAVASNGGSDLLYFLGPDPAATARAVVGALVKEDYVSALFADDALGPLPGALPLSAVGLKGAARTPTPSLVVSFRSFSTGCSDPELCAAEVADTDYQQGQGIHGSFSRADTHNFMAAYGPDFRTRFTDPAPVSNADWAPTLREILGLPAGPHAALGGRVVSESLRRDKDEPTPSFSARSVRSAPAANGFVTVLDEQDLGQERYYDAAGAPGRVVGLRP
jgi:arylsulfatase A-like enzyme